MTDLSKRHPTDTETALGLSLTIIILLAAAYLTAWVAGWV